MARPARHGSRADGDEAASASPGMKRRGNGAKATAELKDAKFHVVAIDYGIKRNILRQLAGHECHVTVVPATTSAEDILALKPDGIFLSNGPGDPAATGEYAVPVIRALIEQKPVFGICLGHQMLGSGRRRQNHENASGSSRREPSGEGPENGKVEITSMNHGFAVDRATLPNNTVETHVSLFDGSNCGPRAHRQAGVLGAIPSRGVARPAGQSLSVRPLCRSDARRQADLIPVSRDAIRNCGKHQRSHTGPINP